MRLTRAAVIAIVSACVALGAASATFAYPSVPNDSRTCADCHGREADEPAGTVAATRKGPHGGYTAGTRKCQTCHSVHEAPAEGVLLLPGATVEATCTSCHDGTGGAAVYGVIEDRTGVKPAASHNMSGAEATNTIPGGDGNTGGSSTGSFSGPGGTLSCNDCHSPHDSQTVEPFTGDRLRASVTSDTAYAKKTNRLLRRSPTSAETSVSVYGAGWCATCHEGRVAQHAEDSGLVQTHPVMDSEEYYYDRVQGVAGADTTQTALGSLGQSNRGYVVPEVEDPQADPRPAPLCQQCHEDARNVGPSERGTNPMLSEDQTFTVSAYASLPSAETTDNPRFQVFPHESDVEYFLVRPVAKPDEDSLSHQLCLNCHSLRHDVPEEYLWCATAGCHDDGDAADIHEGSESGCLACHTVVAPDDSEAVVEPLALSALGTAELTLDCGACHTDDPHGNHTSGDLGSGYVELFTDHDGMQGSFGVVVECSMCHTADLGAAHASRCGTCHPTPRDSFDEWGGGCQQGDCHPTIHADSIDAHWTTDADGGKCGTCHGDTGGSGGGGSGGGGPGTVSPTSCLNCHAAYSLTDTAPPVTTSNALASYLGPARVSFSITDGGLIGIGTTFYRVDGGAVQVGSSAFVAAPGEHTLEFWSVDQSGNVETPSNTTSFTVVPDLEAPMTTSNAVPEYFNVAPTITLTATDASTLGVKTTYYMVNGGPVQTGTRVSIPRPADGMVESYTLAFRSEDWTGNLELWKSVTFTVASGTGTIRLVWGDSDLTGPPGGDAEVEEWTVRTGSRSGPVIASGSAGGVGWSGVIDVVLPVRGELLFVYILEGESTDWHQTWFDNVSLKVPGETVRLQY